ncbi:MAG: hypothetical protein JWO71_1704 [Candidatus Acidoferrum typicum]|nr:hypothetical protein [Candidatus Acidoferrum typicum]
MDVEFYPIVRNRVVTRNVSPGGQGNTGHQKPAGLDCRVVLARPMMNVRVVAKEIKRCCNRCTKLP